MQIERRHAALLKRVKSQLPRRESERRDHPLIRHSDILSAVDTRISMLNMTYMKYIQNSMCCFIPGKVLDELDHVLNIVEHGNPPPRTNETLQELRDISSMAMEFFEEKILPSIREQEIAALASPQFSQCIKPKKAANMHFVTPTLEDMRKLTKVNRRQRAHINCLSKEVQKLYTRVQQQQNRIKAQAVLIQEHTTKLQAQENKSAQQDTTISELKKGIAEWDRKLSALTSEVVNSREDIVKAIFMPHQPTSHNPPAPSLHPQPHKTIIRPRVSQVQAPNTYIVELERKRKASIDVDIPNKLRFILKQDSSAQTLKKQVSNKIKQNITQNISKNIRDEVDDTSKKKYNFSRLFTSPMDTILRSSISNISPKKARYTADDEVLVNLH